MGSLSGVTSYISGNIFTKLTAIYLHKKPIVFMCSTCPSREVDHFLGWTASRSGTVCNMYTIIYRWKGIPELYPMRLFPRWAAMITNFYGRITLISPMGLLFGHYSFWSSAWPWNQIEKGPLAIWIHLNNVSLIKNGQDIWIKMIFTRIAIDFVCVGIELR